MTDTSYNRHDEGMFRISIAELAVLGGILAVFVLPLVALVIVVLVRGKKKKTQA